MSIQPTSLRTFLEFLQNSPQALRTIGPRHTETKHQLHSQGNKHSQGTGNAPTDQETCFAAVLQDHGFAYSMDRVASSHYYRYQPNGSQRPPDFTVYEWDGAQHRSFDFDLKHTKDQKIFLNDGWFHLNTIYVISWMRTTSAPRKKKEVNPETLIGLGQDIPTENEKKQYEQRRELIKQMNSEQKDEETNVIWYTRSANQYKCATRFTPEFSQACYTHAIDYISSSDTSEISSDASVY